VQRQHWLVAAGAGAFVATALLGLPAAVAVDWLAPEALQVTDVRGSLWKGSASTVQAGRLRLGPTTWTLSPLALLRGRVGGFVETRLADAQISGDLSVGSGTSIDCENCRYAGSLASLYGVAPALRNLSGSATIELASLAVRDGWPTEAIGTVRIAGVPITAPGVPPDPGAPSGEFEATVNSKPVPEDGLIEFLIQDGGGPLELTGQLSLRPPGNYELAGRARARADAPPDIVNSLNFLGPKAADGSTEISMSGSL